jgi:hypothetical protein
MSKSGVLSFELVEALLDGRAGKWRGDEAWQDAVACCVPSGGILGGALQ